MTGMMICAAAALIYFEGIGTAVMRILKTERHGYASPVGAAVYGAVLETAMLPCFLLKAPAIAAWAVLGAVTAAGAVLFFSSLRQLREVFARRETAVLLGAGIVFALILSRTGTAVPSDPAVLAAAEQGFAAVTEQRMQGYLVLCGILSGAGVTPFLFLGLLYHLVLAAFSLNVIRTFRLKNRWFVMTLTAYALFYAGLGSWQISTAWAPENWRILMIAMMLRQIFLFLREGRETDVCLILFTIGGGIFVSDGFDMIAYEILYCFGVWMFSRRRPQSVFCLAVLFSVPLYYKACQLLEIFWPAGVFCAAAYTLFLAGFRYRRFRRAVLRTEDVLYEYGPAVFGAAVPVILSAASFLIGVLKPGVLVPLSFYSVFLHADPTRGYLFLDGKWLTAVLSLFRWSGMILLLLKAERHEETQLRMMYILMTVLFLNPLTMGIAVKWIGVGAYASTFEIFFNPFTDILLLIIVYRAFEWQVIGQWILEIFLIGAVLIGNIGSFAGVPEGLYTELVRAPDSQEVQQ